MNSKIPPKTKSMREMSEDEVQAVVKSRQEESANALWRIPEWFSDFPVATLDRIKVFHVELLKFNARLNLISKNTERDADEVHFADCMMSYELLRTVDLGQKVYDFGAGNGFPGLILALLDPNRLYELVESDQRKAEFMKHIVAVLQMKNVQVNVTRLETVTFDSTATAVCRGFASITKTVIAVNRTFPKGGRIYHLKGNNWSSEIAELPTQLMSSWKPELLGEYSLPATQARRAIVCTIKK